MALSKAKRSLLSMLVLMAAAGAALYFGVVQTAHEDDAKAKAQDEEAKAFSFQKSEVKTVTLTAKGATTTIEKDGDNWNITAPIHVRADKGTVEAIVNKLADLKAKNLKQSIKEATPEYLVAKGAEHLKEFGLDQPKYVVKATLTDGKTVSLTVGNENNYDQSLYYTPNTDNKIFLSDSSLRYSLDKGLFDLRDKSIVTHDEKDVQSVTVQGNGIDWAVERDGDGWKLTAPIQDKADKSEIETLLAKISNTKAKSFPLEQSPTDPAQLAKYGFDKPVADVTFAIGPDKAKKTLELSSIEDGGVKKAYARLVEGGPIAEIDANLSKDVLKPVADLRDKTVATFDREKVAKLEINSADGQLVINRTKESAPDGGMGTEQFTVEGRPEKVKSWKVTSALYTLQNLRGAAITEENANDISKYGLDKPKATFAVLDSSGKPLAKVRVGNATTGTRYYVMKEGTSRVLEVEKTIIDGLPKKAEDVLDIPSQASAASPASKGTKTAATGSGG